MKVLGIRMSPLLTPVTGSVCVPSNVPSPPFADGTAVTASWKNQNPMSFEPFVANRSAPKYRFWSPTSPTYLIAKPSSSSSASGTDESLHFQSSISS